MNPNVLLHSEQHPSRQDPQTTTSKAEFCVHLEKSHVSKTALEWTIKVNYNGVECQHMPNKKQQQFQSQRVLTNEEGVPSSIVASGRKR